MCIIEGMAPKTCTVSVTDASGSRHSVEVLAESLYEAAALGLKLLRDADWVDTLGPMTRLQLQVRAPAVMHEVTIQQLQRWLDGAPISPHEAVRKAKLKSILRYPLHAAMPKRCGLASTQGRQPRAAARSERARRRQRPPTGAT